MFSTLRNQEQIILVKSVPKTPINITWFLSNRTTFYQWNGNFCQLIQSKRYGKFHNCSTGAIFDRWVFPKNSVINFVNEFWPYHYWCNVLKAALKSLKKKINFWNLTIVLVSWSTPLQTTSSSFDWSALPPGSELPPRHYLILLQHMESSYSPLCGREINLNTWCLIAWMKN